MEFVPRKEFARMSLNERLGYVFGTIIIYRRMIIGVLNDPEASDTKKFFYALLTAEGLARTFDCIQELFELRQMFLNASNNLFKQWNLFSKK